MFITLDKFQSKLLRWVMRARETDGSRPALNGVRVDFSVMGCDGNRIHAVKADAIFPDHDLVLNGETVDFGKVRAGENIVEPETMSEKYPETNHILPQGEPVFEIQCNPRFIVEVMRDMDKDEPVRIAFHGSTSSFEVFGKIDKIPVYALIMPMHPGEGGDTTNGLNWTPYQEE